MSANEDKDAWKSDYISLLDKPRFEDAQMPEALVLKLKNAPPFFYRDRKFNNFAEGLASKGRILILDSGEEAGCRRRHHHFGGNRQRRAAHRHQHNDPEVAAGQDPLKPDLKQMMHIVIPSEVEESLECSARKDRRSSI
jgi:hypothetical protein